MDAKGENKVKMSESEVKRLTNAVAFLYILKDDLEKNGSISNIHPSYLLEKYDRFCLNPHEYEYMWGVHPSLYEYMRGYLEKYDLPILVPEGWDKK